ncbi:MAG TPA: YetF domain-containing protein [Pilimelia sp.]|nr:YetF domain-containing protein [Pilimelia sp.]
MDAVLRAVVVFLVLMVVLRVFGKRALGEMSTFDFVLVLLISEATQQALLGEDFSITQAALVIATLVMLDRISDALSWRYPWFRTVAESRPTLIMRDGVCDRDAMRAANIDEDEILHAARKTQGLERMDQIKHVVLETSGGLSVIPRGSD